MREFQSGMTQPEKTKDEAVSPVGDFIALVGGFMGVLFAAFLNWYTISGNKVPVGVDKAKVGIKVPVGVLCFMVSAAVFIFAIFVLIGRFVNPNFRLMRSPGWVYSTGSAILFMACIFGLVVTPKIASELGGLQGTNYGLSAGIIMELIAASVVGVAGLLKF